MDNLVKTLSLSLKAKPAMGESLGFNLPGVSSVYNVEKSYVAIDLTRFLYLCYLIIE